MINTVQAFAMHDLLVSCPSHPAYHKTNKCVFTFSGQGHGEDT